MGEASKSQNRIPEWANIVLLDFTLRYKHLIDYRSLSFFGITALVQNPNALDGLGSRHRLVHRRAIEFANKEFHRGCPVLQEQTTAAMRELLSSFVRSFLVSLLINQPEITQLDKIRKIRISLADYEKMSPDEKYDYLIDELERNVGAPFRRGINRFEALLQVFGLSGPIEASVRKDLLLLSQERNVIVHRRGLVDRRFVEACPWTKLKPGERLVLTVDDYEHHLKAILSYVKAIMNRVEKHFGVTRRNNLDTTKNTPG